MAESALGPVIYSLSYCRWYLEALFEKEAIRYPEVMARYVYGLSTRNGNTDNYSSCVAFFYLPWGLLTDCWLCCLCCLQIKGSNISCILLLEKSGGKRIIVKLKRGFKLDNQM